MATFTNQATLSYNGVDTNSNVTTGELVETLTLTKTAVDDRYSANDNLTYIISLVNSGTAALTNLTVTDNLGAYTFNTQTLTPLDYVAGSVRYYVNGVLQTAPTVTTENGLVFTGINVPAGGNALIAYEASANRFAPLDAEAQIENTATATGGGLTTPVTAQETVSAAALSLLSITKAMCPATVTENGQLTYTFVIQNMGNTAITVADDVIVRDTFNPILKSIAVTFNGAAWTEGTNYSYNTQTGLFQTLANQITVPAATYTQDAQTGAYTVTPGVSTLVVTGTV